MRINNDFVLNGRSFLLRSWLLWRYSLGRGSLWGDLFRRSLLWWNLCWYFFLFFLVGLSLDIPFILRRWSSLFSCALSFANRLLWFWFRSRLLTHWCLLSGWPFAAFGNWSFSWSLLWSGFFNFFFYFLFFHFPILLTWLLIYFHRLMLFFFIALFWRERVSFFGLLIWLILFVIQILFFLNHLNLLLLFGLLFLHRLVLFLFILLLLFFLLHLFNYSSGSWLPWSSWGRSLLNSSGRFQFLLRFFRGRFSRGTLLDRLNWWRRNLLLDRFRLRRLLFFLLTLVLLLKAFSLHNLIDLSFIMIILRSI